MLKTEVKVINETGLHARPASQFVQTANKFNCDITVSRAGDSNQYNAKSIMSILALGLGQGEKVVLTADGEGEKEALTALTSLFESGFGE